MLGVVVVLEDHFLLFEAIFLSSSHPIILQNLLVEALVERGVYLGHIADAFVRDAAPKFDTATAMLDRFLDMAWLDRFVVAYLRPSDQN